MVWSNPGPDAGWSWVVSCAGWLVQLCSNGLLRSQGIIYVAVIDTFSISREEASWPFSVCIASACFAGLSVGFLTQIFSVRQVLCLSAFLVTFGYFLCYFIPFSVFWMTLAYGIVTGAGTGLVTPSLALVTNQYFEKARASANGLCLAGITCGAFIFPSCVGFLLPRYGLRGTFLVLGGLASHIFVAALLLRSRDSTNFPQLASTAHSQKRENVALLSQSSGAVRENYVKAVTKLLVSVLSTPMFYLVAFSALSSVLVLMIFVMIVPDFANDVGIVGDKSAMLLAAFSLPDLVGRLCTGWLSDKKFVRRKHVFAAAKTMSSLVLLSFPFVKNESSFIALCVALGALEGSATILVNVLFVEYMGVKRVAMSVSIWSFTIGIFFLLTPPTIGLFRDYWGSYDSIFYLMSGVSLLSSAIWCLEPLLVRQQKYEDL